VIENRKQSILELLYFVSEVPQLYRCQAFSKFLECGHPTPNNSPSHKTKDVDQLIQPEIIELEREPSILEASIISTSSSFDFEIQEAQSDISSVQNECIDSVFESEDYLYEAAMDFSSAVIQEANCKYKEAFENYKLGIDKLLSGANNDVNEYRKRIAKQKAGKYLERAEKLYDNHILNQDETDFIFGATVTETDSSDELCNNIKNLERPFNQLSRYKVIKILDHVMQIQDVTSKKCYAMKTIWKHSPTRSIFLPNKVLYMVPLIAYFQSDDAIFLLLHFASGGKLWDYIKNYRVCKTKTNLGDIFVEPSSDRKLVTDMSHKFVEPNKSADSGFMDLEINDKDNKEFFFENVIKNQEKVHNFLESILNDYDNVIPSFETLSKDMDVSDLISSSQQLLDSVSNTLIKSQTHVGEDKSVEQSEICDKKDKIIEITDESLTLPPSLVVPESNFKIKEKSDAAVIQPIDGDIVCEENILPEECVKQWARELIVAVHSLHQYDIICG
jgi:hypothetical protein